MASSRFSIRSPEPRDVVEAWKQSVRYDFGLAFLFQGTAMNRDSIEKWQAAKIGKALYPGLNYLLRLRQRMEKKGFPGNDPYYLAVCRAYDSMQALLRGYPLSNLQRRRPA